MEKIPIAICPFCQKQVFYGEKDYRYFEEIKEFAHINCFLKYKYPLVQEEEDKGFSKCSSCG
ncbi:MAG: hypothetical protein QXI58_01855 [Candidatus Micrarchaeia archaeon]